MSGFNEFLSNNINVLDLGNGIILSKEKCKSSEIWYITTPDGKNDKTFWVSNNNSNKKVKGEYTGGKAAYSMLMHKSIEELKKSFIGDLNGQLGLIMSLVNNIEFKTGRLINKRSKKSLDRKSIAKEGCINIRMLDRLLLDMKKNGLIIKKNDGYYISRDYIKRGAKE